MAYVNIGKKLGLKIEVDERGKIHVTLLNGTEEIAKDETTISMLITLMHNLLDTIHTARAREAQSRFG